MKIHACLSLALLLISGSVSAIPSLVYDGSLITGATGIIIDGEEWDMTLHEDVSFLSLYELQGIDLLYSETFSTAANGSLVDFFNSLDPTTLDPQSFLGCTFGEFCNIATAYDNADDLVYVNAAVVGGPFVLNVQFADFDHHDLHDITFASWTLTSVPEPPIALLIASGLILYGVARRRVRI